MDVGHFEGRGHHFLQILLLHFQMILQWVKQMCYHTILNRVSAIPGNKLGELTTQGLGVNAQGTSSGNEVNPKVGRP